MPTEQLDNAAGEQKTRRLFVYNGGFLTQGRVRRILELKGWQISLGKPGTKDWVGVWGKSPTSPRGEAVADRVEAPVLRVEDSFLRSIHPGRDREPPIGLNIDQSGVHFDSSKPSDLETLLTTHPLDDTALLNRARGAIDRIKRAHLSKYNAFDPGNPVPDAPYVLVIDQTKGDASIEHGGANAATFKEMLVFALMEHPGNRVVIKAHPETAAGHREGHFTEEDENERVTLLRDPVSPWALMEGATAVYTVSSQLGFEAIYAGHKPRVFGQPFYSGWGLTQDENPVARRERVLTRSQLFAGAMLEYPSWYDPYRDCLGSLEDAIGAMEATARAWREDRSGYVGTGMARWKRPHIDKFFRGNLGLVFEADAGAALKKAQATGRKLLIWAQAAEDLPKGEDTGIVRIEDGFLRSRGLGAKLVPPLSVAADDLGIYYDPGQECRLERHIAASVDLPDTALERADTLVRRLTRDGITKYNLAAKNIPELPEGRKILVPGQVEDDASIQKGCDLVRTNLGLLERTRAENPDAIIIFKPHPDVEAGLRKGKLAPQEVAKYADLTLADVDASQLIDAVDEVWTMTSTLGFEALLRGCPVTCLGVPFYAGWGLTKDIGNPPERRNAHPTLAGLAHACLIDYPRYYDPVTGTPCPVEVALTRLKDGPMPPSGLGNRIASKIQAILWPVFRR